MYNFGAGGITGTYEVWAMMIQDQQADNGDIGDITPQVVIADLEARDMYADNHLNPALQNCSHD